MKKCIVSLILVIVLVLCTTVIGFAASSTLPLQQQCEVEVSMQVLAFNDYNGPDDPPLYD